MGAAAAFDRGAGKIVYLTAGGPRETWLFDVCTNTWQQMSPSGAVTGDLSGGLVYDVDSDRTIAFGGDSLAFYDAEITTGPLEGINNKIKTMKRQAYGFRDMEYFKLKILAIHQTRYALVG